MIFAFFLSIYISFPLISFLGIDSGNVLIMFINRIFDCAAYLLLNYCCKPVFPWFSLNFCFPGNLSLVCLCVFFSLSILTALICDLLPFFNFLQYLYQHSRLYFFCDFFYSNKCYKSPSFTALENCNDYFVLSGKVFDNHLSLCVCFYLLFFHV